LTINQSVGAFFEQYDNAQHTPDVFALSDEQELVIHLQWMAGDFRACQLLFEYEKQRPDVDDVQKHR
jgi:hypothetical protein